MSNDFDVRVGVIGHTPHRNSSRHLVKLTLVISTYACSYPPLPRTHHLCFLAFVISAHACSYPPLPRTRHLCFPTLVISASSLSSLPRSPFR
ncbi:MAG: hypothetical protein Q4D25_00040, partial [Bacteroidales bacterium]|nr:hypothetical protein [Bacteroidales bacterium]